MRPRRRSAAAPLAAGLVAAAGTFAAIALLGGPGGDGRERPRSAAAPQPSAATATRDGRRIFARMACGSCHLLAAAGTRGRFGPDLDANLARHTRESLVAKIVDPYPDASAEEVFAGMPEDYGRRMSARELDALVRFLLAARPRS